MSVGIELQSPSLAFDETAKIPVARLAPDADRSDLSYIEAEVVLIWPYSSSTQRLGVLLAEPDILLRKAKGQVKVTFHGACAREVARTKLGIGDVVKLGLQGVVWTRTGGEVSTPGRKVEWDLEVGERVQLQIRRGESLLNSVDFTSQPSLNSPTRRPQIETVGPRANGYIDIRKTRLTSSQLSPARRFPDRLSSGSFVEASLDPFADDDDYISGRGRKRTKFARYGASWHLIGAEEERTTYEEDGLPPTPLLTSSNETSQAHQQEEYHHDLPFSSSIDQPTLISSPSPYPEIVPQGGTYTLGTSLVVAQKAQKDRDNAEVRISAFDSMGPPPVPLLEEPQLPHPLSIQIPKETAAFTPVLRPLPSPGLALVSPLIQRQVVSTSYFPGFQMSESEADAISDTATTSQAIPVQASPLLQLSGISADKGGQVSQQSEILSPIIPQQSLSYDRTQLPSSVSKGPSVIIEDTAGIEGSDHSTSQKPDGLFSSDIVPDARDNGTTFEVDLEALEQQIDESHHVHHVTLTTSSPDEDEDLYGTAIPSPKNTADDVGTNIAQDTTMKNSTSPGYPVQISSRLASSSSPVVLPNAVSAESDTEIGMPQPHVEIMPIELSDDSSEDDVASEEDIRSQESSDSFGEGEAISDLDEIEQKELTESQDEYLSEGADIDDHSTVEDRLQTPPSVTSKSFSQPVPDLNVDQSSLDVSQQLSPGHRIVQTDGTEEFIEQEDERIRRRSQAELDKLLSVDERETSLSSSGESSSALAEELTDINDGAFDAQEARYEESLSSAANEYAQQEASPFANAKSLYTELQMPSLSKSSDVALHHKDIDQGINSDITKTIYEVSQEYLSPTAGLNIILPDLPEQAQAKAEALPTAPLMDNVPSNIDRGSEEEVRANEPLPTYGERKPKVSQRLSRKSFTTDKIVSEYFTPRRSMRINAASPSLDADSAQQLPQPVSPRRSRRISQSPAFATEVLGENIRSSPKLVRGISTSTSYYPYLVTLHEYFNLQVDVIAICTTGSAEAQKAKAGPKDYHTTLSLTDTSFTDDNVTIKAQFFRPKEAALPVTHRGDVVLLRNMKVQTTKHHVTLLSTNSSAWAVFKQHSGELTDVAVNGPPIEYDDHEEVEIKRISHWWSTKQAQLQPDRSATVEDSVGRGTLPGRITRSGRRRNQAIDNVEYVSDADPNAESNVAEPSGSTIAEGQSEKSGLSPLSPLSSPTFDQPPKSQTEGVSSPSLTVKRRGNRRRGSKRSGSFVHELRDGTKYVDQDGRERSNSVIHELRDGSTYVDE